MRKLINVGGLCLSLAAASPAQAQTADAMIERARLKIAPPGCAAAEEPDDVVVCGRSDERYRLPLPREQDASMGPARGSGAAALLPSAPCGLFAGQRRCGKAEAARHGYGGGRDPITVAGRLLGLIPEPVPDVR